MDGQIGIQARGGQGGGQSLAGRAVYRAVLEAPPHKVAEVLDGRLYLHPRPAPPHVVVGFSLGDELVSPFQKGRGGPGGWWIVGEPEVHFGQSPHEDILVPDIAGWRRRRMPALPSTAYFPLAPDWVCEILSPSTRHLDLGRKRDIYAREGVPHLWLVDPDARTLEAFALAGGAWQPLAALTGNVRVSQPPFDEISFALKDLWP